MSAFTQTQLERIYAMPRWVEDPETSQGYERYQRILRDMERLTAHPWIQDILRGRRMLSRVSASQALDHTHARGVVEWWSTLS